MLQKIFFKNYKLFKERQEIELRPLTVLIGKNSSGKSAITKLPTLLEQSLKGITDEPLSLTNNGVELGAEFRDLVYARRSNGIIELGMENNEDSLRVVIGANSASRESPTLFFWECVNKSTGQSKTIEGGGKFKGFVLENHSSTLFSSLNTEYIGPFRELPKRGYDDLRDSNSLNRLGVFGENAYSELILDSLRTDSNLLKKVSSWFFDHFDGWGVKINEDRRPYYQIEMTRDSGRLNVNIKDVGQGMGQILPLVVAAYYDYLSDILIILEQPELHLHPAAHGDIAELFAKSMRPGHRHYLVETHSNNFILRLRRMIAEGRLNADDVVIYFIDFDEDENTSEIKPIFISPDGGVSFWPEGVFAESMDEVIAISRAQRNSK